MIDTSPLSGQPCISLIDEDFRGAGISITIGKGGHASIGIGGMNGIIVGLSALADGRRAVFVHDDKGREIFAAGVDINGERFIELLAADGSKIWETRDKSGDS